MADQMCSLPNGPLQRVYVGEGKDKPPSPALSSPRLSRKVHDDLTGTEKSGTPLNTAWTLWLDRSVPRTTASQYEATLRKVYTISTIESFWAVYNNIPEPCSVATRYSYHLMRNESRPMWEDPVNKNGGVWKLKCFKWATNEVWKTLLLAVIGEQLSDNVAEGDDIMGVSVSIRESEDLFQIWNRNSQLSEEATVLNRMKELMPEVTFPTVFYKGIGKILTPSTSHISLTPHAWSLRLAISAESQAHQQHYAFEAGRKK